MKIQALAKLLGFSDSRDGRFGSNDLSNGACARLPLAMRNYLAVGAILLYCAGCTVVTPQSNFSPKSLPETQLRNEIIKQASTLGIVDGYYFGEESRNFKTGYAAETPQIKADFALDYEDMLAKRGEDMMAHWESYVPYAIRSDFARQWWSKRSKEFDKQTEKYKILWIHEALLDGGELWFRAVETLAGDQINSQAVLTHDEEQKLVFKYAESEHAEGSLSTQIH